MRDVLLQGLVNGFTLGLAVSLFVGLLAAGLGWLIKLIRVRG